MIGFCVMMWFVAALLLSVSLMLLKGNTSLIHGKVFEQTHRKAAYGRALAKPLALLGVGSIASTVIALLTNNDFSIMFSALLLFVFIAFSAVWLFFIQKKFKDPSVNVIGTKVIVTVDRPLGSNHPKHPDIFYTINYGFIENVVAPDGEMQDAYLLGVDEPVKSFEGVIIAIVHRFDDVEEKWVVAPEGATYTKKQIARAVNFQEKYFKTKIIV